MCDVLLPPGVNPTAVKYIYHIISYHIISYHIISYHIISYHIIIVFLCVEHQLLEKTKSVPSADSSREVYGYSVMALHSTYSVKPLLMIGVTGL
jgi:hypothetical protein